MNARPGDKIEEQARLALAERFSYRPRPGVPTEVLPQSDGTVGCWVCITCGYVPQNNWMASLHDEEKPLHKLAWRTGEGTIEAP